MEINLNRILIIVLSTFTFVAFIIPYIKKLAFHVGAVDMPNNRRVNKIPMPTLGGLGIFLGFLLGYMLFGIDSPEMVSILIASFLIVLLGILDDIKPIKASIKLVVQFIVALILVFYGNMLLDKIDFLGFYVEFGLLSYPLTVLFILGTVNCINLIDGLDGLVGGISSIYFLTIGIIAVIQNRMGGIDVTLAFIMLGSTLGFLVHNFHPAKIYAGDTGSTFLGLMIAIIALLGFKNVTLTSLVTPLLILGIPILDTGFAIIRRLLKGQNPFAPDKSHLHHQLLNMRFSHRTTVLIIYGINILFAVTSIIHTTKDPGLGKILYFILVILCVWFVCATDIITDKKIIKGKKRKN